MQSAAQSWLVLTLTGSAAVLGLTRAITTIPYLVLAPHAGTLADRRAPQSLAVLSQLIGAAIAGLVALLVWLGVIQVWLILLLALVSSCATALGWPSTQALIPLLAGRRALGRAVGLNSVQGNLSGIIGPPIGGWAVAVGGIAAAYAANALSSLVAAVGLAHLRLPNEAVGPIVQTSTLTAVRGAVKYARSEPVLLLLLSLPAIPALFATNYTVLFPIFARDILHIGPTGLGVMLASVSAGALIAAVVMFQFGQTAGSGKSLVMALATIGGSTVAFAVSTWPPFTLFALFALGASQVVFNVSTLTLILARVPEPMRGRILSIYLLTSAGLAPFGSAALGITALVLGPVVATVGGGVLTLLTLTAIMLIEPDLWQVRAAGHGGPGNS